MKSLKEINLGVGTSPGDSAQVKPRRKITMGGPSDSAGSTFSSYMGRTFNDDDYSEEEMPDHILRKRIKINGKYSLNNTLENIDEGAFQVAADLAKAIPGVDQIVGNTELLMQSAQAKEAFTGLNNIIGSLAVSTGVDAFNILSTDSDFQKLLNSFYQASYEEKESLKTGVEKIIDVIKNMIITAAMTFDSLVAIPAFLGGPTGVLAEIIANVSTTAGTLLRGIPVEKFVFTTLTEREGIVSQFIDVIAKLMTAGGIVGKLFGGIASMASSKGGEIVEMFFSEPQELLRRLGDLYRAASGYEDGDITKQITRNAFGIEQPRMQMGIGDISNLNPMSENKYSILFLLEAFDKEMTSEKKGFTDKYDDHKKLKGKQKKGLPDHLQKAIIGSSKNEMHHDHDSLEEIDLEEFSGAGAIGAAPVLPLGMSTKDKPDGKHIRMSEQEKIVKEQIRRMRILEAYHQKTSQRRKK